MKKLFILGLLLGSLLMPIFLQWLVDGWNAGTPIRCNGGEESENTCSRYPL